jgi:hypothetical protein
VTLTTESIAEVKSDGAVRRLSICPHGIVPDCIITYRDNFTHSLVLAVLLNKPHGVGSGVASPNVLAVYTLEYTSYAYRSELRATSGRACSIERCTTVQMETAGCSETLGPIHQGIR